MSTQVRRARQGRALEQLRNQLKTGKKTLSIKAFNRLTAEEQNAIRNIEELGIGQPYPLSDKDKTRIKREIVNLEKALGISHE